VKGLMAHDPGFGAGLLEDGKKTCKRVVRHIVNA